VWWRRADRDGADLPLEVACEEFAACLGADGAPLVLDVRTPAEYAAGHIPQAILLPLQQLDAGHGRLPRQAHVVCVCRSGHRSLLAARRLRELGLRAQSLRGGMLRWSGPVAAGGARHPGGRSAQP
jgi:rhodanese-related sulfurtransferase